MEKLSQFELEAMAEAERTKRQQNISILEQSLAQARSIAEVCQTAEEHHIARREIQRLEDMLAEELKLFNSAGISKDDTDVIASSMRF